MITVIINRPNVKQNFINIKHNTHFEDFLGQNICTITEDLNEVCQGM